MSEIDIYRDALFGNPPSPTWEPSREGSLAAFTALYQRVLAIVSGVRSYATVASLPASVDDAPVGTQARVFADPTDANNTYWIRTASSGPNNGWVIDQDYIDSLTSVVQPLVDQATLAASQAVTAANSIGIAGSLQTIGRPLANAPVTGTALGSSTYVFATALAVDSQLSRLRVFALAAGEIEVSLWSKSGNDFARQKTAFITVAAGLNDIAVQSLPELTGAAGLYPGIYGPGLIAISNTSGDSGGFYDNASAAYPSAFTDAAANTGLRLEIGLTFQPYSGFLRNDAERQNAETSDLRTNGRMVIGKRLTLTTGSSSPGRTWVLNQPATAYGILRSVRVFALATGTLFVKRFTKVGDVFTQVGTDLPLAITGTGIQTLPVTSLAIAAPGEYLGFYAAANTVSNAGDAESTLIGYYDNSADGGGNTSTFTDATVSTGVSLQVSFRFDTYTAGSLFSRVLSWIIAAGQSGASSDSYAGVVPTGYILVWVLGQSNAAGRALVLSTQTFEALQGFKYVRTALNLQTLADPTANDGNVRGSALPAFGKAMQRLSKGKLGPIVVNSANGGSPLLPRPGNVDWSPTGTLRAQAATDLANALADAAAKKLPIVGCCIYVQEGESDGDNGVSKADWMAAWDNWQAWMASVIGSKVPILMTRIGTTTNAAPAPANYQIIRDAQDEIAQTRPNVHLVHAGTRDFVARGLQFDAFHYVIQGYEEIGDAAGTAAFSHAAGQRPLGYTW